MHAVPVCFPYAWTILHHMCWWTDNCCTWCGNTLVWIYTTCDTLWDAFALTYGTCPCTRHVNSVQMFTVWLYLMTGTPPSGPRMWCVCVYFGSNVSKKDCNNWRQLTRTNSGVHVGINVSKHSLCQRLFEILSLKNVDVQCNIAICCKIPILQDCNILQHCKIAILQ